MCRGAKIFFGSLSGCQKWVFGKICALFVFVFFAGKSKNMRKWKGKFQKRPRKIVFFWVVVKKNVFFCKMSFFRKIGKHYLCSDSKKKAHFCCNYLFLGYGPFLRPFQVTKHYKNRGFSRHRGKPKMALLVAEVPFWEGASKGALLSVIPKSCALLKTLF